MNTSWMRAWAVASILLVTSACTDSHSREAAAASSSGTQDARERLDRRQQEFIGALSERDADAMADLFAEDAVLHVANMPPLEGREAIRRFYANMFGFLNASSATVEATHLSEAADLAYSVGSSSNEFRGPDGPVAYAGKYVLVWRKVGQDWVIAVYSISSNQPG